ncbi:NAD(P)H-dependent amine dehydrogenase family protein [Archaeoglobus sp.]
MKVVIYGFGQIGRLLAKACVERGFEIVGAVDINPELVGKRLSDFGIDSDAVVKGKLEFEGDLAFLTTGSYLDTVFPQIEDCIKTGFNVISTCETLAYPEHRYPELADKIDELAKEHNVTVLGSGINPGFLLDTLPTVLSAVCVDVKSVKAIRSIDALKRRTQFQKKVGIGLSVEEFEKANLSGHVGYAESALLISEALGVNPKEVLEGQEPVVKDGIVQGIKGFGEVKGDKHIRIEFHAYANAEEFEMIEIEGDNGVVWKSSGVKGDLGTVAVLVNLAKAVVEHRAGLIKMTDLIPFRW